MKLHFARIAILLTAILTFSSCSTDVSSADTGIDTSIRYNYRYLTYCQRDCYDMDESTFIRVKGDLTVGNKVALDMYLGYDKGVIRDYYFYQGVFTDDLGTYDLFYQQYDNDRVKIYGNDFAFMQAWNDSYYWSFSNDYTLYKKRPVKD